jgi:hypothetical protein
MATSKLNSTEINCNQIVQVLTNYKGKSGLYIIKPNNVELLKTICIDCNYEYKSQIAYIGKALRTKHSDLFVRGKQEMGWSNFEGATFVRKIGQYLKFDLKDKRNKLLQNRTREFICSNFTIECIEFDCDTNLLEKETEYISTFKPCLNRKKNK